MLRSCPSLAAGRHVVQSWCYRPDLSASILASIHHPAKIWVKDLPASKSGRPSHVLLPFAPWNTVWRWPAILGVRYSFNGGMLHCPQQVLPQAKLTPPAKAMARTCFLGPMFCCGRHVTHANLSKSAFSCLTNRLSKGLSETGIGTCSREMYPLSSPSSMSRSHPLVIPCSVLPLWMLFLYFWPTCLLPVVPRSPLAWSLHRKTSLGFTG